MGAVYLFAVTLNLLFTAVEAAAGWWGQSMGLLSDAGHNLSDVCCLLLAMLAFRLSRTKATHRFT
nr:cation transporter [Bacteroidales bacterium]